MFKLKGARRFIMELCAISRAMDCRRIFVRFSSWPSGSIHHTDLKVHSIPCNEQGKVNTSVSLLPLRLYRVTRYTNTGTRIEFTLSGSW